VEGFEGFPYTFFRSSRYPCRISTAARLSFKVFQRLLDRSLGLSLFLKLLKARVKLEEVCRGGTPDKERVICFSTYSGGMDKKRFWCKMQVKGANH